MAASHERASGARIGVLLPLPLTAPYDYRCPAEVEIPRGAFVRVPLGAREAIGVVWGEARGDVPDSRLKEIAAVLDVPPMPEVQRRFVEWVADYTLSPSGAVLRMAMSVPDALVPPRPLTAWRLAGDPSGLRLTRARRRVLEVLAEGPPLTAAELAREAAVSPSVVKGLTDARVLAACEIAPAPILGAPDWRRAGPMLSPAQHAASAALRARLTK